MSQASEELAKLRDLSPQELSEALERARDTAFRTRLGLSLSQVTDTSSYRAQRKKIARIKTLIRQQEIAAQKAEA